MNAVRAIIASGGTGGHIFPAVATAREIKRLSSDAVILFATSSRPLDKKILGQHDYDSFVLNSPPLPGNFGVNAIYFPFRFIRAFFEAFFLIRRFKPDVVVGFGGYSCVPIMLAAISLRKRTLIHEQNARMGKANRLLARFVDKVALSFPMQDADKRARYILTGNAVRSDFFNQDRKNALDFFSFRGEGTGLLVLGGSQGSRALNAAIVKTIENLPSSQRGRLRIIHLCGSADYDFVKGAYDGLGIEHRTYPFLSEIHCAYAASDIVISRCGASTIWEIAASGIASILVPYPYAGYHQLRNAAMLRDRGAAILVEQSELTPELLKEKILELVNDANKLRRMKESASRAFNSDGAKKLAAQIIELAHPVRNCISNGAGVSLHVKE